MKKIAFIRIVLFLIACQPFELFADTIPPAQQEIIFKTKHASEVLLVWSLNDWQAPALKDLPPGSYIEGVMAYSPMKNMNADSFVITLQVQPKTYVHYMFWLAKDERGDSTNNWDTYYGNNYSLFAKNKNAPRVVVSTYDNIYPFSIDVLRYGWVFVTVGLFIFLAALAVYYRKIKTITARYLFVGMLTAAAMILFLIRLQMNNLYETPYLLPGAGFSDLLFLFLFAVAGLGLLQISRNSILRKVVLGLLILLLLGITITGLTNIETVKQIGRPLNYQWLYYSGFLQSADAKNALSKHLTAAVIKNLAYILISLLFAGYGLALLLYGSRLVQKTNRFVLTLIPLLVLIVGYFQQKDERLSLKNTLNPVTSFVASWLHAGKAPALFSMDIPADIRNYIVDLHQQPAMPDTQLLPGIKHVIVFVLESTPAEYIDVYDDRFGATPNLQKWQSFSRTFENMYAHIPSTPASLFSLVSGLYPPINYRTVIIEKPAFPTPSISGELRKQAWNIAMFSAADLNFSNMQGYLEKQNFGSIYDMKNIDCSGEFIFNYADMDGIDDECLADEQLKWLKTNGDAKTFSITWTMQTHHPYSFNGTEKKYVNDNPDLNRYLNALHHGDVAFGKMMEGLQAADLLNETLVIVIGDHGEAFGRHKQYTHASNIYEENLHIPCLLINPVLFKGEKDNRNAGLIDIAPTIAQITGTLIPADWQGRNLLSKEKKNRVFYFSPYSDFLFGTRVDNWKLIFNASNNSFELYDLSKDPREKINLANDYPEIVKREYSYIAAWVQYQNKKMEKWMKE